MRETLIIGLSFASAVIFCFALLIADVTRQPERRSVNLDLRKRQ